MGFFKWLSKLTGIKIAVIHNSSKSYIDQRTGQFPETFKTWEHWSGEYTGVYERYFSNDELTAYIEQIQTLLRDEVKKVNLRILGFAGLGKTRLVFEALKDIRNISKRCIYCNAAKQESEIPKTLLEVIKSQSHDIIIIDNCDLKLYHSLTQTIGNHPTIHLITIYHEPNERNSREFIRLTPENFEGIIPQMLEHFFSNGLSENDIRKISEFAQGFPMIAVLMSKAKISGNDNIGELNDEDLTLRILGIESLDRNDNVMKVLKACSIFSEFAFKVDLGTNQRYVFDFQKGIENHRSYISENLTWLIGTEQDKLTIFNDICIQFNRRGVLEEAGRFIFIRPKPLAIHLAGLWWRDFIDRGENAADIMAAIYENGLWEHLCKQMRYLDFLPEAQQLTADLCGEQAPFGQTEVINTDAGSRLFRALAEVNPEVITDTLYAHYADADKATLQSVRAGRRNLVWALEKLCFRKETFEKAVKVMMAFAYGENENISNNATGQFSQLFQVFLAGTEVNLEERYKIVEYGLSKNDEEYTNLTLNAISRSVTYYRYNRLIGAEAQGSNADLVDYRPTVEEVKEYLKKLFNILKDFSCSKTVNPNHKTFAMNIIASNIRSMYANGHELEKLIYPVIKEVYISNGEKFWQKAFANALETYQYEKGIRIFKQGEEEIKELINLLFPKTFNDKYEAFVQNYASIKLGDNGQWDIREKDMSLSDTSEHNITQIAKDHIDEIETWNFDLFYKGSQQPQIITLSQVLANTLSDVQKDIFIDKSIEAIKQIDEELNLTILTFYLKTLDDKAFTQHIISEIESFIGYEHIVSIVLNSKFSLDELTSVLHKSQELGIPINTFERFSYGNGLKELSLDEIFIFCNELNKYDTIGTWIALQIIFTILQEDKSQLLAVKDKINTLLFQENLLNDIGQVYGVWVFYITRYIEFLFEDEVDDEVNNKLANDLIGNIIYQINNAQTNQHFTKQILELLVNKYFDVIWTKLGNQIIGEHYWSYKSYLGWDNGAYNNFEGILFLNPDNYQSIVNWCDTSKENRLYQIAYMMPLFSKEEEPNLHSFAKIMINRFGSNENMLIGIKDNLTSFSSVGSRVPYLEYRIKVLNKLKNHSIKEVRDWIRQTIARLKDSVKAEQTFDSERGIW